MVKDQFIEGSWRWGDCMSKYRIQIRLSQLSWQILSSLQLYFIFLHLLTREQVLLHFIYGDQRQREIYLRSPGKSTAEQGTRPEISEFQTNMLTMGQLISPLCVSTAKLQWMSRSPLCLCFFKTKVH